MPAPRRPVVRSGCHGLAVCLLLALTAVRAAAQGAECATAADCQAPFAQASPLHRELWTEAAAIHQVKRQFVAALQAFTRAQAGIFADEGEALRGSLAAMHTALDDWDRRIAAFEARAARARPDAEVEIVRATVFLDRQRVADAVAALELAAGRAGDRPDAHALQALAFGLAGRDAEVIRALRRAVALDPDNPVTRYGLARGLMRGGDPAAAQAWRDVYRLVRRAAGKGAAAAPFERVDLLGETGTAAPIFPQARYAEGFARLRAGDYAAAIAAWRRAAPDDPMLQSDAAASEVIARAAGGVRQGDLAGARRVLTAALAAGSESSEMHRLLGLIAWLGDADGAGIEQLRTAIRLAPADERARLQLADALAGTRRTAEAEQVLQQAVTAGLDSGNVRYRLSQLQQRQAALPEASRELQASEAHGAIVGRDHLLQSIARLLVEQADFEGAVDAYARRIDVNPNSAEAHRQLGEIFVLLGRHDEALAEFAVAVWLDPGDARALAAAGQVHVRLLQYAEAAAVLQPALAADPNLLEARYALGTALLRSGKAADGRRELELFERRQAEITSAGQLAFKLDALRRDATRALAAGDGARAVELFTEVAAAEPDSARSHRDLGIALLRERRAAEAVARLEEAARHEPSAETSRHLADAYFAAGLAADAARARMQAADLLRQEAQRKVRELGGQPPPG